MAHQILILGAGRIGSAIAEILLHSGDYEVSIADRSQDALGRLTPELTARSFTLDVYDSKALTAKLRDFQAVLSACSFHENPTIARCALEAGCSYFDLTEDVECTRAIMEVSQKAKPGQVFMPQCGLAPGFIGIVGHDMTQRFDEVHTIKMRVGALPEFPSNMMMYNLTWSTDGLINEYCNPCEAIQGGEYTELMPLEGLENFSLDGVQYEAFNTSGGLGTLCETLKGKVRDLTYKTVRYPGHCYLVDFLLNGLRLGENKERRDLLKQIMEYSVPVTSQDLVLLMVVGTGHKNGQLAQVTEVFKVGHAFERGHNVSAIQRTTAGAACATVDLVLSGQLAKLGRAKEGFLRQEDVPLAAFMENRFAAAYRDGHETRAR